MHFRRNARMARAALPRLATMFRPSGHAGAPERFSGAFPERPGHQPTPAGAPGAFPSAREVGLRVLAGQGAQIDTTTAAGRLVVRHLRGAGRVRAGADSARRAYGCAVGPVRHLVRRPGDRRIVRDRGRDRVVPRRAVPSAPSWPRSGRPDPTKTTIVADTLRGIASQHARQPGAGRRRAKRAPSPVSDPDVSRPRLIRDATFLEADRQEIALRRGPHNRLGFAYQVAFVRVLGRFPQQAPLEIDGEIDPAVRRPATGSRRRDDPRLRRPAADGLRTSAAHRRVPASARFRCRRRRTAGAVPRGRGVAARADRLAAGAGGPAYG